MLSGRQVAILVLLGLALWGAATAYIRLLPGMMADPLAGDLSFVTAIPMAWLSIILVRRAAGLSRDQLMAGVSVVGAAAMLIDGAVLHWAPAVYGTSETVVRLGAAWLLWGYGVSLAIALLMVRRA